MFSQQGFGQASTGSAFGQSSFGKPAFSSSGFGGTGNSLFGQPATQQPSTSLFGSTQQQSTFGTGGIFGSQPQATTSTGNSVFGNQQASTSASGGMFGSSTPAFGQNKPTFGGFGSNTSGGGLFGQPTMFSQPNQTQQGTSLFGGTNTAFGSTTTGTTIKFTPVTSTDTMMRNGNSQTISTRHVCITCMKEYENKSLEELRYEDYKANRKVPQQGAQATGSFFGSTAQPSLFGASTSTAQPATSLFGGENKSLFGQTASTFGQPTSTFGAANNSLFPKPNTGFGTSATTQSSSFSFNPSSTFGQPNTAAIKPFGTAASQSNNLFGSNTSQATPAFGAPQTSGFGSFGTNQNQTLNFNQNKPTFNLGSTASSGFGFGTNTATNNTSLFGSKPATNTFGLPTNTTSLFGASTSFGTQPAQTTNLMSSFNKPASGFQFNSNTTPSSSLGSNTFGGGSLFGNTVAAKPTGSLFGNPTNTGGLFGNTSFGSNPNPTFGSGLNTGFNLGGSTNTFNNTIGSQVPPPASNVNTQQILNMANLPYFGAPTLYKGITPTTTSSSKLDELILPAFQKNRVNNKNLTVSLNPPCRIKVKPVGSANGSTKSLFDGLSNDTDDSKKYFDEMRSNPKRLSLVPRKPKSLNLNLTNIANTTDVNSMREVPTPSNTAATLLQTPVSSKLSPSIVESKENISSAVKVSDLKVTKSFDGCTAAKTNSSDSSSFDFKLTRKGYYIIPSLNELKQLKPKNGPCIVDGFTIGHEEFGSVCFLEPIDISELNNLDLDSIVEINFKHVIIYPDDENKPPIGTALNKPAKITLLKVWPKDKSSGELIKDVQKLKDLNYESKVMTACKRMNVEFVHYIPEIGSWCFKVKHFSKYGLLESDEEGESEPKKSKLSVSTISVSQTDTLTSTRPPVQVKEDVPSTSPMQQLRHERAKETSIQVKEDAPTPSPIQRLRNEILVKEMNRSLAHSESLAKNILNLDETMEYIESSTEALARQLGTDPYKVQLMKQYFDDTFENNSFSAGVGKEFFMENKAHYSGGSLFKSANFIQPNIDIHQSVRTMSPTSEIELDRQSDLDDEMFMVPNVIKLENKLKKLEVVPVKVNQNRLPRNFSELTQSNNQKNILNVEYFKQLDRRFSVHWIKHKRAFLTTCNDDLMPEDYSDSCNLFDIPPVSSNLLRLVDTATPCLNQIDISLLKDHLQVSLQNSKILFEQNCPFVCVKLSNSVIHDHCNLVNSGGGQDSYDQQVWKLCVALWGTLDTTNHSHDVNMKKKSLLTEWLESVMSNSVTDKASTEEVIFNLVTRHKIHNAIEKAHENSNFNLAVMLSMLGSNATVQGFIQEQLSQYVSVKADNFINEYILKLMLLVSGQPLYDANSKIINVCETLDWKIAFGLHLWYLEPSFKSIADVLQKYELAWSSEEAYCLPPSPTYANGDTEFQDLCYHLLVLYSRKSHSLVELLNPGTHSMNSLDFRLSWFLMQALKALGYSHLDEKITTKYHVSFASQLLSYNLWEFAVFVMMHIENEDLRRHHIDNILQKNVELCASTSDLTSKESFLIEHLKIPAEWIYNHKGHLAMYKNEFWDACEYYLKAKDYCTCHKVLFDKVVPISVLNDQYIFIEDLLNDLYSNISYTDKKTWWKVGGEWLMNYFSIAEKLNSGTDDDSVYEISPLVLNFIQDMETKYRNDKNGLHKSYYCEVFERLLLLLKKCGHSELALTNNVIPISPYIF